jgi:hypothetical protein
MAHLGGRDRQGVDRCQGQNLHSIPVRRAAATGRARRLTEPYDRGPMSNGGPMIMPPKGEPVPERCLACERGRCEKCWGRWSDYSTGNSWVCDCPHDAGEDEEETAEPEA